MCAGLVVSEFLLDWECQLMGSMCGGLVVSEYQLDWECHLMGPRCSGFNLQRNR